MPSIFRPLCICSGLPKAVFCFLKGTHPVHPAPSSTPAIPDASAPAEGPGRPCNAIHSRLQSRLQSPRMPLLSPVRFCLWALRILPSLRSCCTIQPLRKPYIPVICLCSTLCLRRRPSALRTHMHAHYLMCALYAYAHTHTRVRVYHIYLKRAQRRPINAYEAHRETTDPDSVT